MTSHDEKLRIALTLGDPGGIGPELVMSAVTDNELWKEIDARPIVFGSRNHLPSAQADGYDLEDTQCSDAADLGRVTASNGRAALTALEAAHHAAFVASTVDAIVTAPISKEAIHLAGCIAPGHTELLAEWCGLRPETDVRMMLAIPALRVVLHTIHIPLREVPAAVTQESLLRTLELTGAWCQIHSKGRTRVAVCGLNPHAGENGHIGTEDRDIISPAIAAAARIHPGLELSGPWSADTVFARALDGDFDLVVAMYHDQGLIPVKTLDMHHGVNLTVGLPYVRTSPDHGTAFGLAGKGIADPRSFKSAIRMAAELARARKATSSC
jgi:4-hydroxythreonine-4-phosphate dehydrogenase